MTRKPDEESNFEKIRKTNKGAGDATAMNKGKIKRRLKFARHTWKKNRKK